MHILFLTDNFPPECNAPASRTHEHCLRWVRGGHRVTVITGAPNFPEGVLFPGYRNRWYQVESMDGIRVVRVKTYITANQGFVGRIVDFLSFMLSGFLAGLVQPRPDLIVGTSPQFFTVCAAWVLARWRCCPWVFELRDLWPASILAVGVMREGRLIRALEALEMRLYRSADAIVTVTESFRRELVGRGINTAKLYTVIGGVDPTRFSPRPRDPELAHSLGLTGRFVVGYIGTQGMAHALEDVLAAADRLRDRPQIAFLLVGSGATHAALRAQAASLGLPNVHFVDRQPKERMPAYWAQCDCALVHLRNEPLFSSVIPSKIFEAMGMGLPLVLAMPDGEAAALVRQAGAGLWVPPGSPDALVQALADLAADPEGTARLGAASRAAAAAYSRDTQAARMLAVLTATATRARESRR